jgi:ABC-2 type transport system permease protein/sodium transport system permease protein
VPDLPPGNSHDRLSRLGRLMLKELREILRDRRTIVTLVLMPLFMYPVLSVAFQQFFVSQLGAVGRRTYTIGFRDDREAAFFIRVLALGGLDVVHQDRDDGKTVPAGAGSDAAPMIRLEINPRMNELVENYEVDVGVRLLADSAHPRVDPRDDVGFDVELLYLPHSSTGPAATALVEKHLLESGEKLLADRLKHLQLRQRPAPVHVVRRKIEDSEGGTLSGLVSIRSVIPFILILMTVTGAVYPAIDLTAGERERGTLEVLMSAPIPRVGILLAKYVTVLAVALLTAAANLVTMTVTIAVTGLGTRIFGEAGYSIAMFGAIFALLLLFAAFFSAVLLVITSTARSFKEAQAYLIPLMLVSLAPGMLGLLPDVKLSGILLVTPLANIVLLGRDLLEYKATGPATLIVVVSTVLYAAAAIGLAARIFGSESVLFNSQSGWSDLWSRPREVQTAPTVTAGIVCLALMFPAYYLLFSLLGFLSDNIGWQLLMGVVMTALVFGGIPLAACRLRRIAIGPAFQAPRAGLVVFTASALVGLSLWTICHEAVVLLHWEEVTLDPRLVEALQKYVANLRTIPAPVVVGAMALIPALFEESLFRGFLFPAFRSRTTPATAIVATAVAFGFFHWISPSLLATERFVSSTFVGLVLGWVRWRTGSLLPGILLHALHNTFVILVAYYEPQLQERGIGTLPGQHLPHAWIAAGAAALCLGLAVLYVARRSEENRDEPGTALSS